MQELGELPPSAAIAAVVEKHFLKYKTLGQLFKRCGEKDLKMYSSDMTETWNVTCLPALAAWPHLRLMNKNCRETHIGTTDFANMVQPVYLKILLTSLS